MLSENELLKYQVRKDVLVRIRSWAHRSPEIQPRLVIQGIDFSDYHIGNSNVHVNCGQGSILWLFKGLAIQRPVNLSCISG